ncbi:polysaccharide lyase family 8 super-sandwich domain-containing protein [Streptomyces sp. M10(2022)]
MVHARRRDRRARCGSDRPGGPRGDDHGRQPHRLALRTSHPHRQPPRPDSLARHRDRPLAWLRYADAEQRSAVGYVFLSGPRPSVALDTVTRSRRLISLSNPETPVIKQVFTLSYDQTAAERPASMAHVLVPNASGGSWRRTPTAR